MLQVCFKLLQKGFDRLFESVSSGLSKHIQHQTHATVHPSHLLAMTVESFLLPVRALGAKKLMTTAGRCLCVNNHHLQSQLDKQHHKPRCNRSTHLVSPPLLEAHLAIKPGNSHLQTSWTHAFMFSTWFVGGWSSAAPGKTLYGVVFFAFFCNTFSRQVFLDVLPPKVIRWIGPKKDLKTRHGVSQQWSKIKYYDHLPFGFSFPTMIVTWLAYCSGHHSTKTSQERRVFGFRPEIVDIKRWISITFDP